MAYKSTGMNLDKLVLAKKLVVYVIGSIADMSRRKKR